MTESLFAALTACDVCGGWILLRAQVFVPVGVLRATFKASTKIHVFNQIPSVCSSRLFALGLWQTNWGEKRAVRACRGLFTTASVGLLDVWLSLEKRSLQRRRTSCLPQRHYSRACCPGTDLSPLSSPNKAPYLEGWIKIPSPQGGGLLWVLGGLRGLFSVLPEETAGDGAGQNIKEMRLRGCRDLSLKASPNKDLLSILQYFYIRKPQHKYTQFQETALQN